MLVWIDREFVPQNEACVPILSHGFCRGLAVFDAMKVASTTDGPAFVALEEHVDRFIESCKLMSLDIALSKAQIIEACKETARRNKVEEGPSKIFAYYPQVTWGTLSEQKYATVAIFCGSYADFGVDPSKKKTAMRLGISSFRKLHQETVPIKAKVAGYYVGAYLTAKEAMSRGYDEAIMADTEGRICEGGSFSTFFVINGVLCAPPQKRVLDSTTRAIAIAVAKSLDIKFEERDLYIKDLDQVDEAFSTGSVMIIMPVSKLEGKELGDCPGPVTKRIREGMNKVYRGEWPEFKHLLTYL